MHTARSYVHEDMLSYVHEDMLSHIQRKGKNEKNGQTCFGLTESLNTALNS